MPSRLGTQMWMVAIYAGATNLKGISSTKLEREIGAVYKIVWYMMCRVREVFGLSKSPTETMPV